MIDFLKYRWFAVAFSVLIFATFIGAYVYKYVTRGTTFNYNVEFTGGIQVLLSFTKPVTGDQIAQILESKGWERPVTREFSPTEYIVRVKKEARDVQGESEKIRNALQENLTDNTITIKATDSINVDMGAKLRTQSAYAVIISLILMLFYIAFRFLSFSYAMGAVVSLLHDAVAILTIFLLFDKEISINVIGAILAVLGYSINDTIVIFARIRENINRLPNTPMYDIINISINETLSRTILTTVATLLVVVALFVFGGEILRDLSLALLIGIVFGIYSTIYIATPVVLWLYKDTRAVAR
jgi:preprotein translocase subunit SecF